MLKTKCPHPVWTLRHLPRYTLSKFTYQSNLLLFLFSRGASSSPQSIQFPSLNVITEKAIIYQLPLWTWLTLFIARTNFKMQPVILSLHSLLFITFLSCPALPFALSELSSVVAMETNSYHNTLPQERLWIHRLLCLGPLRDPVAEPEDFLCRHTYPETRVYRLTQRIGPISQKTQTRNKSIPESFSAGLYHFVGCLLAASPACPRLWVLMFQFTEQQLRSRAGQWGVYSQDSPSLSSWFCSLLRVITKGAVIIKLQFLFSQCHTILEESNTGWDVSFHCCLLSFHLLRKIIF